ncbi:hypothetical protein ACFFLJ_09800 [Acetobacter farinalis]
MFIIIFAADWRSGYSAQKMDKSDMPAFTPKFLKTFCLAATGIALLGTLAPARAEDTLRQKQTQACKGDALKLCALAIPNEKKITSCMERKKDRLSPQCRAFFDAPAGSGKTSAKKP